MNAGFVALMVSTDNFGAGGFGGATDQRRRREAEEAAERDRKRRVAAQGLNLNSSPGIYPVRLKNDYYPNYAEMSAEQKKIHLEIIERIYSGRRDKPDEQTPVYDWSALMSSEVTKPIMDCVQEKREESKTDFSNRYREEPKKQSVGSDVVSAAIVILGVTVLALGIAFRYLGG